MSSRDKTATALHGEHGEGTVHGFSTKEPAMTITTTKLTRAAGLAAVAGSLLFIGVQIKQGPQTRRRAPAGATLALTSNDHLFRQAAWG